MAALTENSLYFTIVNLFIKIRCKHIFMYKVIFKIIKPIPGNLIN